MSAEHLGRSPESNALFSPLAAAIVEREVIENERVDGIINRIAGRTITFKPDVLKGLDRLISLIRAQRIIDGEPPLTPDQREEVYTSFGIDRIAEIVAIQDPSVENPEEASAKLELMLSLIRNSYDPNDPNNNKPVELYDKAKELAAEVGVSVEDVYARDELFEEAVRRNNTPQEFIDQLNHQIGSLLNEDTIQQSLRESIKKLLSSQIPIEMNESELDILIDEVLKDPSFAEEVNTVRSQLRSWVKETLVVVVGRFWGNQTAQELVSQVYFSDGNATVSKRSRVLEQVLNERGLSALDPKGIGKGLTHEEMIALNEEVERRLREEQA